MITPKNSMEIIRQRSFISHDSKHQRSITVEYTVKSNIDKLKNAFLSYNKFLPSLIIRDQHDSLIPLMSSNDVELLYSGRIKRSSGEQKKLLEITLNRIRENKEYLIWFSLKKEPMQKNELRTFTLVYIPETILTDKPVMKILIEKQSYPIYFSLFSPSNFDFVNPKYIYMKDDDIKTESKPPIFVKTFRGYQTLSFRITTKANHDFILMYELKSQKSAKVLTEFGIIVLSLIPMILFSLNMFGEMNNFKNIFDKNIEIGLFVIGASLLLPQLQHDDKVRKELIKFYMIPIGLGVLTLFVGTKLF